MDEDVRQEIMTTRSQESSALQGRTKRIRGLVLRPPMLARSDWMHWTQTHYNRWAKAAVAAVIAASISPATAIIFRRTRG